MTDTYSGNWFEFPDIIFIKINISTISLVLEIRLLFLCEEIDRKRTPWLVAVMHTPWYSTNKAHEGEGEKMRKAMEGLLYRAQADVVFAGHIHTYERFVSTIFVNLFLN